MRVGVVAGVLLLSSASSVTAGQSPDPRALFAAERAATGGASWNSVAVIRSKGSFVVGGAPSPFEQMMDHRNGFSRQRLDSGGVIEVSGFNGASWDAIGGLVYTTTLPGLKADAISQAYVARDGWWNPGDPARMTWLRGEGDGANAADVMEVIPTGGNPVDVWINRGSHLITKMVLQADFGPTTTTYADWRTISGVRIPFEQTTTDAMQATTTFKVDSASTGTTVAGSEFAPPVATPRGSIANGSIATVPFRFDGFDHGHIFVEGRVNAQPVTLIFDTGALNFFTPGAAKRLNLKTGGGSIGGGNGEHAVIGGYAAVPRIALGNAKLKDQTAVVAPLPYVAIHPRAGIHTAGLVGAEFVWTFRTEIDYLKRTLRFSDPHAPMPVKGTVVPFLTDGRTVYIDATIDGATGLFGIDTGDPGGVTVFRKFADAHKIFQKTGTARIGSGGVGGTTKETSHQARSFSIAGIALPPPTISLNEDRAGVPASKTLAGMIGAAILSRFTVTLDPIKRTIAFAPNRKLHAPYLQDRVGMSLTQEEPGRLKILSVDPDSAAQVAGLRSGDAIVAVNGRSVAAGRIGVYDLAPLRFGTEPFGLTVTRDGHTKTIKIVPKLTD